MSEHDPLAQAFSEAWGYIYKLTHRETGKFFIGHHAMDAGEAPDFYFGGNEEIEREIESGGQELFERKLLKLVHSREEAYLEEVYSLALALHFARATYNEPLGATSEARELILEALPSTATEDVLFFFSELSVEAREELLAAIRDSLDPAVEEFPEKEISSISLPLTT